MTRVNRAAVAGLASLAWLAPAAWAQDILLEKGTAPSERGTAPSRSGTWQGDHWSPYTAPSPQDMPAEAKVHLIVKGDTLWDLARTYLGDPYLWPQIWEVNPYVTDPHWIYPGDPLVIPQPLLIAEAAPEEPPVFEVLPAPQPVAKRYDVYCSPTVVYYPEAVRKKVQWRGSRDFIDEAVLVPAIGDPDYVYKAAEPGEEGKKKKRGGPDLPEGVHIDERGNWIMGRGAPRVVASELPKVGFGEGEVIYVNRGEVDGLFAGTELLVSRPEGPVFHPVTGEQVGVAMQLVSTLSILCSQERTATAVVKTSCDDTRLGDLVRVLEPIPIPLASEFTPTPQHCTLPADRPGGYVIHTKNRKIGNAEEDLVNVDLGAESGVVPGDFLVVWRESRVGPSYPPTVLGDAVILMVEKQTATAKILASYQDINIGDRVRLR